ncbi:hypothetical protein HNO86_02700 [Pseudomonas sp. C1C7]|uniref:hypothetical protein n=1 Tax=Pseudomonas sp. C1C7 TaxID=2735272 RepID=UPI00158601E8|nr:hypothetical protein [Pseudomonas sp. C1C7]NUT73947.1 hypothetical protein [Pseudomonas sp. C1C7]
METSNHKTYLVNGNIVVFIGTHDESFEKDILTSTLIGELVSNSKNIRDPEKSISEYEALVGRLGWVQNSERFKKIEFFKKSLWNLVDLSIGTSLTEKEKQTLYKVFLQLKEPSSEPLVIQTILDRLNANMIAFSDETNGAFKIGETIATSTRLTIVRNDASIITVQIAFKTNKGINIDILDQPLLSSIKNGKPNIWTSVSSLAAREYEKHRALVIKKIGNHIHTSVLRVPTPDGVS